MTVRVGFDIGGTFTDVIVLDAAGRPYVTKVLSLLEQVGDDIGAYVEQVAPATPVSGFVHGTTIASNAVIEGTTALTGLLTTRGFRDELEMRGQRRPNIYDVRWNRLDPLIARRLRLEVDERVLGTGEVERALDVGTAVQAIDRLVSAGVEAIAVCLINAYLNPTHERALEALIAERAPGITVCLSSVIHPEIREYERASTTTINASLVPVVTHYLDRLEGQLGRFGAKTHIMQSNGGIMSSRLARERPSLMIESGPAAGVLSASRLARENDWARVLSFDMGGTTAKACLIEDGIPLEKAGGEVGAAATMTTRLFGGGGHVLRVPWLDIVEVGAGGGSVAWVDAGGALRVGPHSAGADPGPACYGRGGCEPTVTDANVVLGYMNPLRIAGDTLPLDYYGAVRAVEQRVAKPLGLALHEAAYGITQVANATMMRALRAVSTERGRDPRTFTLMAFGGAGPMHAVALAEATGIGSIRIPIYPGLFSALGLLLADYRQDHVRSVAEGLSGLSAESVRQMYEMLEEQARVAMSAQDIVANEVYIEARADLRYGYQVSELSVDMPPLDADVIDALRERFEAAHQQAYGYVRGQDEVELVNLRMRALARASQTRFDELSYEVSAAREGTREAYFGAEHGHRETPVLGRGAVGGMGEGARAGPLIIEDPDTTVVVPPGWRVYLDAGAVLVLERD